MELQSWNMSLPSVVSLLENQLVQRRRSSLIQGVYPGQDQIVEEVTNDDEVKVSEYQSKKYARQEGSYNLVNEFDQEDLNEVTPHKDKVTQVRKVSSFKWLPFPIISMNQIINKETV